MANINGRRCATIVTYGECQRNCSLQPGRHATDGCLEFRKLGGHPQGAQFCAACGCHREFHRKEEVVVYVDPTADHLLLQAAAPLLLPPPPPPPPPAPVLAPQNPNNLQDENLGAGEIIEEVLQPEPKLEPESEPVVRKGKGRRSRLTEAQREAMRAYSEEKLGWSLQGHNAEELEELCGEIGITVQFFKVWMNNNRRKFLHRV